MPPRNDESPPNSGPLLSSNQTMWIVAIVIWFTVSVQQFLTGNTFLGTVSLLLLVGGGIYRLFNP